MLKSILVDNLDVMWDETVSYAKLQMTAYWIFSFGDVAVHVYLKYVLKEQVHWYYNNDIKKLTEITNDFIALDHLDTD